MRLAVQEVNSERQVATHCLDEQIFALPSRQSG
jgi:hypothetical protein